MISLKRAIWKIEIRFWDRYVGCVRESEEEFVLDLRYKDDDEWSDDDAWSVSKKTGKIRGLGGVEGFLFDAPVVWQRETYKEKGHYVTGQERKKKI